MGFGLGFGAGATMPFALWPPVAPGAPPSARAALMKIAAVIRTVARENVIKLCANARGRCDEAAVFHRNLRIAWCSNDDITLKCPL
jgi:hypothetical protein